MRSRAMRSFLRWLSVLATLFAFGDFSQAEAPLSGASYSVGIGGYAGYSTPTDIWSIKGSDTKTILIFDIRMSGHATGTNQIDLNLVKRSTANTGGTPTSVAGVRWDSRQAASTATIVTYAAAPTLGTLEGNLCACQLELPAQSGVGGSILEWQFNRNGASPLYLRGTNEMVTINLGGSTLPNGTQLNITVEWIEQ